jgi:hypothetical protein
MSEAEWDALTPEEQEGFDCDECPVRANEESLTPFDRKCLRVHEHLNRRVVHDLALSELVLQIFGLKMTSDEAFEMLDSLAVIHEYRRPVNRDGSLDPDST